MTSSSINNRIDHEMSLSELDQVAGAGAKSFPSCDRMTFGCPI